MEFFRGLTYALIFVLVLYALAAVAMAVLLP